MATHQTRAETTAPPESTVPPESMTPKAALASAVKDDNLENARYALAAGVAVHANLDDALITTSR